MKLRLSAGLAAGLIAISAAPAMAANVTVRVEGASTTLVDSARVATTAAPVSKAGHDCSGTSVGGALDKATAGNWTAGWDATFGHFVQGIMGETPSGDDYWSLWINHKLSSVHASPPQPQEGDDVLFVVDACHFDGMGCSNAPVLPLGLTAPANVAQGVAAQVAVVGYDAGGDPSPVAGASVG